MITGGMALMVLPSLEPVQTRADVTKTVLIAFVYSAAFLFMVSFNVMAFAERYRKRNDDPQRAKRSGQKR